VGRLEPDTGFLAYLEALRLLHSEHGLALPLQVCGDGSLRAEGERIAAETGLAVTFHGRVADVTPYLAGAQFAFTSGFLGMLEAMAAGAVVCAVYDNPLKEDYLRLFPGADSIIIAGSAAELVEQMRAMMGDEGRAEAMATAGRAFAQEQTWAKVAELYLDLYGIR
jgi:glycosyltransferase involved in cell wall biosynthesis